MNWEESRASTPLKRDFLRAWFRRDQRFFLTGGSALGMFYLDHRRSYDLDLFTDTEVEGKEAQNLALQVASVIGAECEAVRTAPDFHRFRITRGDERELVDLDIDECPEWMIKDIALKDLRDFVRNLRLAIARLALPPES